MISKFFSKFSISCHIFQNFFSISKKKASPSAMRGGGGGMVVGGWGMDSKGRGYDFDVCARLENSTTTPSSIFPNFFPKISKHIDPTLVFILLKMTSGPKQEIWSFFSGQFVKI